MFVLKAKNLGKEWNGRTLFEKVTFDVAEGERIALFGRNGTGKSTLLNGLLGQITFDEGSVQRLLPLEEWGWMNQAVEESSHETALTFVQSGTPELYRIKRELARLERELGEPGAGAGQTMEEKLGRYGMLQEQYMLADGFGWELKVEKSLQRLQLTPELWNLPYARLSGGQKTRAQLARVMVREPQFIVLDEPTNHLDEATLDWLEKWIADYAGTVLYVSHDRAFIDRTATAVIELTSSGCRRYVGGYTAYREQKRVERRTQEALHKKQEQERQKLLESIRRYEQWFRQAHKAAGQNDYFRSRAKKNVSRFKAKESALERLESSRVKQPRDERQLSVRMESEPVSASTLLRMEKLNFAYTASGRTLLDHFSLTVERGDRLAVIGPNGAGKTTLLKLMIGELKPQSGMVRLNPQTVIGYFAQELNALDPEETLLDSLLKLPDMTQSAARTILGCFLFSGDDAFKKIGDLSMGEKCRAAFLRLYFGRANLLVLDEPTNYLDIDTREIMEEALLEYPGTLVIVTHDRYLIRKLADRLVVLAGSEAITFPGTYEEYASRDRRRAPTGDDIRRENERSRLQLRLAVLMSREDPEDEEEKARLLEEIRQIKAQLDE